MDQLTVNNNPFMRTITQNAAFMRRAKFLSNEASIRNVKPDGVTRSIIYGISDFSTIGSKGDLRKVKKENRRMSKAAKQFLDERPDWETWNKNITNEHPLPLSEIWKEIQRKRIFRSARWVVRLISMHPTVLIRKEEDDELTAKGYKDRGLPKDRYGAAKIEFHYNDVTPIEIINGNQR